MFNLDLIPGAIGEMFAQVSATRKLTQADRYGLMAAIITESMTEEEKLAVNRLLRSVIRQRVKIATEISALL